MALNLSLIAVMSLGISGLSIYLRNVATFVEKAVEQEIANVGEETELLNELLRAQLEDQVDQGEVLRAQIELRASSKSLDLKLKRK